MEMLSKVLKGIKPLDQEAMEKARKRQDELTKPQGSLGILEDLGVQMAGITGEVLPSLKKKVSILFAADHGVVEEGISAYPKEVTLQMAQNFIHGGAGINVLAREAGADILLVDIGMAGDLDMEGFEKKKVRNGTANMVKGPAMAREEALESLTIGIQVVSKLYKEGVSIFVLGEMGIGNTTASSAILSSFADRPISELVGRGTGIEEDRLPHKIQVIERALKKNSPDPHDPVDVLAKVGGLEIGGMAGVFLGAAYLQVPVIIDGFISGVAALLAYKMHPGVVEYMIPSHASKEPGHSCTMELMGLRPVLDLDMRLGEGTGAALMLQVVEAALKIQRDMATFEEAMVSNRE